MAAPVLGIDLGTTNSVVAVATEHGTQVLPGADGSRLVPSVVSFHPSGLRARRQQGAGPPSHRRPEHGLLDQAFDRTALQVVGGRAGAGALPFELEASPTGGVLVKTRGESYTLSEIGAFVLREVRSRAEAALGHACTQAVITVPANFNELQRAATKAAGRVAGLDVLRILNEPTAAALAYGYRAGRRERVGVFDLGGGTFDLTVLDLAGEVFEVLATAGDSYPAETTSTRRSPSAWPRPSSNNIGATCARMPRPSSGSEPRRSGPSASSRIRTRCSFASRSWPTARMGRPSTSPSRCPGASSSAWPCLSSAVASTSAPMHFGRRGCGLRSSTRSCSSAARRASRSCGGWSPSISSKSRRYSSTRTWSWPRAPPSRASRSRPRGGVAARRPRSPTPRRRESSPRSSNHRRSPGPFPWPSSS